MRLTNFEIKSIKNTAIEVFGINTKIYLFGSRTDDTQKGGDIDLYVETDNDKKIQFLLKLEDKIGEQKIDVILSYYNKGTLIETIAKNTGILL
jgi:predicted nucleotidyltransferase